MGIIALLVTIVFLVCGVLLIVSGVEERRSFHHEHTGVGRIAIGSTLLGMVVVGTLVAGAFWLITEFIGKLANI